MKRSLLLILGLLLFGGCWNAGRNNSTKTGITQNTAGERAGKDSLFQSDSVRNSIRHLKELINQAEECLQRGDSSGAWASYENARNEYLSISPLVRNQLEHNEIFEKYLQERLFQPLSNLEPYNELITDTTSTEEIQADVDQFIVREEGQDTLHVLDSLQLETDGFFHIPHQMNNKVELAIKYFVQTPRGRKVMERWLQRSGRYEQLIKNILKEEGVPEDLFYLAMIESGLNPRARSYARAVGIWQFISSTGKAYGLNQSFWYDERSDIIKSTRAAARHLKDLYEDFGDWYLAMAGYNYSPRKLKRKLTSQKANAFWELRNIPRQTRNYIPTFLAARHIAKDPERFGFQVVMDQPLEFDTVTIRESVDLHLVAEITDTTYQTIAELNPAILRWVTPPDVESWILYLPKGSREKFLERYQNLPQDKKVRYVQHRVRRGETLSHISYRYGVPVWLIKQKNNLRNNLIRVGQNLIIPVPYGVDIARFAEQNRKRETTQNRPVITEKGKIPVEYVVRTGDNLSTIAAKFGVTISGLKRWNGIGYRNIIYPNQKLTIWLPKDQAELYNNGNMPEILMANTETGIFGPQPEPEEHGNRIIYTIRYGDTLWEIARKFGTTVENLKEWNNLKGNKIRVGEKLVIYQ